MIVAIAGPNGAGKSTFFHSHLRTTGLRFINADILARELQIDAYKAAETATAIRNSLVKMRESFVFETVFSDPVGEKLDFLLSAATSGYSVVLCFIGIESLQVSDERVAMRVSQGGHDVPWEKLRDRFPRTMTNLHGALQKLPFVLIFDNGDLAHPFRHAATFEQGTLVWSKPPLPRWLPLANL